ncbi:hypothetical protein O3M35_004966 [Rhynocoris fuscipes]|uniref:Uncharacterized protein n=1 Tax=Rhynocoris fuscipes TaxID=488301 RepID=A0AAW1DIS0_9HEMI
MFMLTYVFFLFTFAYLLLELLRPVTHSLLIHILLTSLEHSLSLLRFSFNVFS